MTHMTIYNEEGWNGGLQLPPSPPGSDKNDSESIHSTVKPLDDEDDAEIPLPPLSKIPTTVLDIDVNTPDFHVSRDPRMIRLTGVHPFNVESPLSTLFDQGFLTPPELFYVRNHGAVPQVMDEEIPDWDITIEGMVENPVTFTFRQILEEFEQVTLPITLVCAGNRRKEQNQIRKSQGFSWGAAGVSTSLFTGPMLADVVRRAKPTRKARFLCMEGADSLPNGKYGTSIKLSQVMTDERGIMLAHKMNGEPLTPDHGKPIRVVVPGQIGGRSVKWLKRIIISDKPSDNWYHKYDNRVLPTMVTPEESKKEDKWWNDERYAIYDLSVNSAIAYPAHEETITFNAHESYTFRGYAYSGGMRRITRVEISIDKGATWELADIDYPEDRYRETERHLYGGRLAMARKDACYCWCFWKLPIEMHRLANAEDVVVRAMDDSMNIQPRDMYWSVLGMMHNAWFRVAIRRDVDGVLRFEHPTQPALQPGGWMERVKKSGGDFQNGNWGEPTAGKHFEESKTSPAIATPIEDVNMINNVVSRTIEIDEFGEHGSKENPWFVVNGEVYDGTAFLNEHPGGAQSIISAAGLDATDEFMGIHSESAKAMMPAYHIGTLSSSALAALSSSGAEEYSSASSETFLNPRAWINSTLISKQAISWDTRIFTFHLSHAGQRLGLPVGQHLLMRLKDSNTGEVVVRPYTPISNDSESKLGVVEVLIKVYFGTESTRAGRMTVMLDSLPLGEKVAMKGPLGKFRYLGAGRCSIASTERTVSSFVMICAGSGITPIYAVVRAVMQDKDDFTRCLVLDSNRLEEDILCKEELDSLSDRNENRCKIVYTLTKPGDGWTGRIGRIGESLVKEEVDKFGGDSNRLWLVCGPVGLEKMVTTTLGGMGVKEEDVLFF